MKNFPNSEIYSKHPNESQNHRNRRQKCQNQSNDQKSEISKILFFFIVNCGSFESGWVTRQLSSGRAANQLRVTRATNQSQCRILALINYGCVAYFPLFRPSLTKLSRETKNQKEKLKTVLSRILCKTGVS